MKNAFLVGDQVYLRPPEKEDVDELLAYWDVWVMGLLREEWEARYPRKSER